MQAIAEFILGILAVLLGMAIAIIGSHLLVAFLKAMVQ